MLKLGNMELPRILSRKNKILLKELSKTDFKLRYQGSVLGYLWAILRPMMLFAILYVVFSKILRFGDGIPHYPVYLLCGTILWNFFTECTSMGIQAIVMRGDLIRKLSFPKWIITSPIVKDEEIKTLLSEHYRLVTVGKWAYYNLLW